jgi:thiamine biosynthesis lipoprotein
MNSSALGVLLLFAQPLQLYEAVEPHMGTLVRIKLYADTQAQAAQAFEAAFARIHELDEMLSDYQPESELNRVTRQPPETPVPVSADLYRILEASQELAESSSGAFDVTIGPLSHLWRDARKQGHPPDPQAIKEARARTGFHKLHLDPKNRTARFDEARMQLDAGGIAKGYAADCALAVITKLGISSALVAASGDLAFSNPPPGRRGWKIRLEANGQVLELANAAASTSGDAEQHLDSDGARYSHIIDPATGIGLTRDIVVSIVAPNGITADGLTKVVSVLGAEKGLRLAARDPHVSGVVRESSVVQVLRLH